MIGSFSTISGWRIAIQLIIIEGWISLNNVSTCEAFENWKGIRLSTLWLLYVPITYIKTQLRQQYTKLLIFT